MSARALISSLPLLPGPFFRNDLLLGPVAADLVLRQERAYSCVDSLAFSPECKGTQTAAVSVTGDLVGSACWVVGICRG